MILSMMSLTCSWQYAGILSSHGVRAWGEGGGGGSGDGSGGDGEGGSGGLDEGDSSGGERLQYSQLSWQAIVKFWVMHFVILSSTVITSLWQNPGSLSPHSRVEGGGGEAGGGGEPDGSGEGDGGGEPDGSGEGDGGGGDGEGGSGEGGDGEGEGESSGGVQMLQLSWQAKK